MIIASRYVSSILFGRCFIQSIVARFNCCCRELVPLPATPHGDYMHLSQPWLLERSQLLISRSPAFRYPEFGQLYVVHTHLLMTHPLLDYCFKSMRKHDVCIPHFAIATSMRLRAPALWRPLSLSRLRYKALVASSAPGISLDLDIGCDWKTSFWCLVHVSVLLDLAQAFLVVS